ncbi:uncharacterized protein RJT20DRAFT_136878 [Scheffersomyces xylosifermentans]|uniref:uncharacterized protein n=1 Tax=Scheffersomyces xylosifermentans TaxID=1304137 RepID=UPI00315DEEC2
MSSEILKKIPHFPPTVLQTITDNLSKKSLRTILATKSRLKPYAFRSMYNDITIDYISNDGEPYIKQDYSHSKDKTNDFDDLIIDEYCQKDITLQRLDDLSIFNTVYNFISFLQQKQAFVPKSIKFADSWSLIELAKSYSDLLKKVEKLEVCLQDTVTVDENVQYILDLPYRIERAVCFLGSADFSSKSLKQLFLMSQIEDKESFFEKVPNLMILELRNSDITLDDLQYLPKTLRKLTLTSSLLNENLDICKFDLPSRLNEFQLCFDRSDDSFFTGENSVVDLSHLLNLTKVTFTAKGMDSLDQLILPCGIQDLKLQGCDMLASISSISKYRNLLTLNVKGCPSLTQKSFFVDTELPSSLKVITFIGRSIDGRAVPNSDMYFEVGNERFFKLGSECKFPPFLEHLDINADSSMVLDGFLSLPPTLTTLKLRNFISTVNFEQLKLPGNLLNLELKGVNLITLNSIQFPLTLVNLDLSNNGIFSILNTNLSKLSKLSTLNLRRNNLKYYGSLASQIPQTLKYLDLKQNQLVDCHLSNVKDLHTLDLSDNKFDKALEPEKLRLPSSLKVLKMEGNSINSVSSELLFSPNLLSLNLSVKLLNKYLVESLPQSLKKLKLSTRSISKEVIDVSLDNLKYLDLTCNEDNGLYRGNLKLQNCKSLHSVRLALNFAEFDLHCLPLGIRELQCLGKITSFIGDFSEFTDLKSIAFSGCEFQEFLNDENELRLPQGLFALDFYSCDITDISKIKWNDQLKLIRLAWTYITEDGLHQLGLLYQNKPNFIGIMAHSNLFDTLSGFRDARIIYDMGF